VIGSYGKMMESITQNHSSSYSRIEVLLLYNWKCRDFSINLEDDKELKMLKVSIIFYCSLSKYHIDLVDGISLSKRLLNTFMVSRGTHGILRMVRDRSCYTETKDD
jgi:hypothetical protein